MQEALQQPTWTINEATSPGTALYEGKVSPCVTQIACSCSLSLCLQYTAPLPAPATISFWVGKWLQICCLFVIGHQAGRRTIRQQVGVFGVTFSGRVRAYMRPCMYVATVNDLFAPPSRAHPQSGESSMRKINQPDQRRSKSPQFLRRCELGGREVKKRIVGSFYRYTIPNVDRLA